MALLHVGTHCEAFALMCLLPLHCVLLLLTLQYCSALAHVGQ